MRAPRYNVAIRGDARTIKALFARESQLTWGERGEGEEEKRKRACPRFDVIPPAIRRYTPTGTGMKTNLSHFVKYVR